MITYDDATHTYYRDGVVTPSVTQVLTETGYINKRFYNQAACDRGTAIHKATEKMDLFGDTPDHFPAELQRHLTGWQNFLADTGAEVMAIEKLVDFPALDYAGTLDRIILWKGKLWIVDIKSGGKSDWHRLQIAGYGAAEGITRGLDVYLNDKTAKGYTTWIRSDEEFRADMNEWAQIAQRRLK